MFSTVSSLVLLSLASSILAKTDLAGCTSSNVVANGGASVLWYVPGSGEVCSILDCGGGQAPPKSDVPGCAAYTGTASYSPSFLPSFGPAETLTATGAFPTGSLLTDTSIPHPASTLVSIVSPTTVAATTVTTSSADLSDSTTTLGAGSGATSSPSLVTSALVFDTSALTSPVTNTLSAATPTTTASAVSSNVASGSRSPKELVFALVGAAAGFAML